MEMYAENKFELNNYKLIQKQCKEAKDYSRLIIIYGETGTGKTEALKQFSKNDLKYVKYISLSKTMTIKNIEK